MEKKVVINTALKMLAAVAIIKYLTSKRGKAMISEFTSLVTRKGGKLLSHGLAVDSQTNT